MTIEGSPVQRPAAGRAQELRAAHSDRDTVVEVLRVAAGDGRLTPAELDQRLEAALTAKTFADLAILTADLATPGTADRPVKETIRIDCHSGSAKRDGRWIVPRRIEARVTSGSIKLDLTQARILEPDLELDVSVRSGSVTLVTRPGIEVDTDDVAVRSGSVGVRQHQGQPTGQVILRVRVSGQVGSGSFKARPPRRTFLAWLLRRPLEFA